MWKKIKDLFSVRIEQEELQNLSSTELIDRPSDLDQGATLDPESKTGLPNLSDAIRRLLAPTLRADGFTGSGRNFRRNHTDWIIVLSVETSRSGSAFALNVGFQPKFAPDSLGKEVDPKKIKVQLCEFRRRVFTPDIDVWWQFEADLESMDSALRSAADAYVQQVRPLTRALCGEQSPFAVVELDRFSVEALGFGQFDTNEGRLALAISRYHYSRDNWLRAQEFAKLGLQYVGISVGLQRDLENLIEMTNQKLNHQGEALDSPPMQDSDLGNKAHLSLAP